MQFNKKIYNVCFLNAVYAYLLGRDTSSAMNPFICEISQEESYKVVQDERDYSEYVQMYIIKKLHVWPNTVVAMPALYMYIHYTNS